MPKVSIFMSSYNHAQHLREAIDSALAQTFRDFELFIVDDASTDESWEIIQGYSDPRIKALRNSVNHNDKVMMNRVISEMAQGEYIAVHHSDNAWEPRKLEEQVAFLDAHAGVGAVFTRASVIDEQSEALRDKTNFFYSVFDQPNRDRHAWLRHFFYFGNALCHPSVLIRKACYDTCGLYRLGFQHIPDLDMWARLCALYEIHVLPEKLTRYRVPSHRGIADKVNQAVTMRKRYEFLRVLEHYRALNREDLILVFPQASVYDPSGDGDTTYALARVALETFNRPEVRLFGLNLVFDLLNDPIRAERLERLHCFTSKDFSALVGQQDVFSSWAGKMPVKRVWDKLRVPRLTRLVRESGVFDAAWYLAQYPDVAASGVDPATHYLLHGGFEGRDPGPHFSSREHYARHPELARRRVNPLVDHLRRK